MAFISGIASTAIQRQETDSSTRQQRFAAIPFQALSIG
jgi:hypothetical protein